MPLLDSIIQTFLQAAPYLLLGLFFSAIVQSFVPKAKIASWIGQNNFRSVFVAAAAGVPMSLCSCGVLPMAMSLRKSGASRGATLSFLISTPEIGLDSFMLSLALLDPMMAIVRPMAAFVTAMVAGVMENCVDHSVEQKTEEAPKECCQGKTALEPQFSWPQRLREGFKNSFVTLLSEMAPWLISGMILSGVISYLVPSSVIEQFLGKGMGSMVLMLVAGIPLYVCASASTPIAASLLLKGASPGAALVFLLAGPATNATTILMVHKFLGKKAVVIYLLSISICALGSGMLLNDWYAHSGMDIRQVIGHAGQCVDTTWQAVSAVILAVLMGYALIKASFK
ncbi:MAG: SO_0444 family Cu/Zn efflux transporter [Candidatus Omnitrophica bacterium]|nr:SO_0444 family Cu/Zn efflux transporter [Candidatus Omnitrophota bacterium]